MFPLFPSNPNRPRYKQCISLFHWTRFNDELTYFLFWIILRYPLPIYIFFSVAMEPGSFVHAPTYVPYNNLPRNLVVHRCQSFIHSSIFSAEYVFACNGIYSFPVTLGHRVHIFCSFVSPSIFKTSTGFYKLIGDIDRTERSWGDIMYSLSISNSSPDSLSFTVYDLRQFAVHRLLVGRCILGMQAEVTFTRYSHTQSAMHKTSILTSSPDNALIFFF